MWDDSIKHMCHGKNGLNLGRWMMWHILGEFWAIIDCHSDEGIRPLKYHPVSDSGIGWKNLCPNYGYYI